MDIVDGAQPGEQGLAVVLERIADPRLVDGLAIEQHVAPVERDQAGDHVDDGALAAAVRAEHRDHLAARQVEVEILVDDRAVELLGEAAHRAMGAGRKPAIVRLAGRGHDRSILHPYRGTRPSEHQLAAFLSRTTRYFAVSTFCFSTPISGVK